MRQILSIIIFSLSITTHAGELFNGLKYNFPKKDQLSFSFMEKDKNVSFTEENSTCHHSAEFNYFTDIQYTKDSFAAISGKKSFTSDYPPRRPWVAAAEVVGLDTGLYLFDRYALHAEYAQVTWDTIRYNLKHGFVWDNDNLSTNLFWHPYTGGLYFNMARSNGLNFWASIPYAFGGTSKTTFIMPMCKETGVILA